MIDWDQHHAILLAGTRGALTAFFNHHGRNDLCAIGFVFELENEHESFHLCADRLTYRCTCPNWDSFEAKWNSGGYEFPASLLMLKELGAEWCQLSVGLHKIAAESERHHEVYEGLVMICCRVLADLVREGFFGNWSRLDFNVSEVNDPIGMVEVRDGLIRRMIASSSEPF